MIQPRTVLVTGSHTRGTHDFIWAKLDEVFHAEKFERLVAGGADFVDTIAIEWAETVRMSHCVEYADWKRHALMAGPMRNERMLKLYKPYLVLAFNGDRGTRDMMARAREAGIEVREFNE